jgi:hypothetical protein
VSNYELMMNLIDDCKQLTIDRVLTEPDVAERVELYNAHREQFCDQIARCSTIRGNVVVLDLRERRYHFRWQSLCDLHPYPLGNPGLTAVYLFASASPVHRL